MLPNTTEKIIQCDFDGTLTKEDVSFMLLDACANGDWRSILTEYQQGKISVGRFNTEAFKMVKQDRQTLVKLVREKAAIRPGIAKLVESCRNKGFRFIIVSNGLDFYIKTILEDLGVADVEVVAARTTFGQGSVDARYFDPNGQELHNGFKETYTRHFLKNSSGVIYIGNGPSDIPSAELSEYVFATDGLLKHYQKRGDGYTPFETLEDIVRGIEAL